MTTYDKDAEFMSALNEFLFKVTHTRALFGTLKQIPVATLKQQLYTNLTPFQSAIFNKKKEWFKATSMEAVVTPMYILGDLDIHSCFDYSTPNVSEFETYYFNCLTYLYFLATPTISPSAYPSAPPQSQTPLQTLPITPYDPTVARNWVKTYLDKNSNDKNLQYASKYIYEIMDFVDSIFDPKTEPPFKIPENPLDILNLVKQPRVTEFSINLNKKVEADISAGLIDEAALQTSAMALFQELIQTVIVPHLGEAGFQGLFEKIQKYAGPCGFGDLTNPTAIQDTLKELMKSFTFPPASAPKRAHKHRHRKHK